VFLRIWGYNTESNIIVSIRQYRFSFKTASGTICQVRHPTNSGLGKIRGIAMDDSRLDRRNTQRRVAQQQPQQSAIDPHCAELERLRASHDSPRKALLSLANEQARKQSGRL